MARERDAVEAAITTINSLRLTKVDLEFQGSRFSALFPSHVVAGEHWTPTAREALVASLEQIVAAADDPAAVESTVRCTALHDDVVVETLFGVAAGRLTGVSRARPAEPAERDRGRTSLTPGQPRLDRLRIVAIAVLVLSSLSMLVWSSGLIDRAFAADAKSLRIDLGPFGDLLLTTVDSGVGTYRVRIQRGATYPTSSAGVPALLERAESLIGRAAINAVVNGAPIYVHLRDAEDQNLHFTTLDLRSLLASPAGEAVAYLPGRRTAHTLALTLTASFNER